LILLLKPCWLGEEVLLGKEKKNRVEVDRGCEDSTTDVKSIDGHLTGIHH
jgi:hypothetical protein